MGNVRDHVPQKGFGRLLALVFGLQRHGQFLDAAEHLIQGAILVLGQVALELPLGIFGHCVDHVLVQPFPAAQPQGRTGRDCQCEQGGAAQGRPAEAQRALGGQRQQRQRGLFGAACTGQQGVPLGRRRGILQRGGKDRPRHALVQQGGGHGALPFQQDLLHLGGVQEAQPQRRQHQQQPGPQQEQEIPAGLFFTQKIHGASLLHW